MKKRLAAVVPLAVLFWLLSGDFSWQTFVVGLCVAAAVVAMFGEHVFTEHPEAPGLVTRLVWFVPFVAVVQWDVIVGTWRVALIVLGLRTDFEPGILEVPIGERTRLGVAVTGLTVTLSPDSYLVGVDLDEEVMYFHVIDTSDPERTRERFDHLYGSYQRHVFP